MKPWVQSPAHALSHREVNCCGLSVTLRFPTFASTFWLHGVNDLNSDVTRAVAVDVQASGFAVVHSQDWGTGLLMRLAELHSDFGFIYVFFWICFSQTGSHLA